MTDQTTPDVTNNERRLARDWAEHIESNTAIWAGTARVRAAARVILSTVPAPSPPTLADMTPEERAACRWMQCDVAGHGTRYVIANPDDEDGDAGLVAPYGDICWLLPGLVTPRPDLPRLEWPGDKKPAPALPDGWRLADHKDHGRVIVTNTTPDPSGHVYFVGPADDSMGCDRFFCDPARLTYLEQGADTSDTVPESTLAVGSAWDDAGALRWACMDSGFARIVMLDCDGEPRVWDAEAGRWRNGGPMPGYTPYTIVHTEQKADQ